jgi:hypothetical protein
LDLKNFILKGDVILKQNKVSKFVVTYFALFCVFFDFALASPNEFKKPDFEENADMQKEKKCEKNNHFYYALSLLALPIASFGLYKCFCGQKEEYADTKCLTKLFEEIKKGKDLSKLFEEIKSEVKLRFQECQKNNKSFTLTSNQNAIFYDIAKFLTENPVGFDENIRKQVLDFLVGLIVNPEFKPFFDILIGSKTLKTATKALSKIKVKGENLSEFNESLRKYLPILEVEIYDGRLAFTFDSVKKYKIQEIFNPKIKNLMQGLNVNTGLIHYFDVLNEINKKLSELDIPAGENELKIENFNQTIFNYGLPLFLVSEDNQTFVLDNTSTEFNKLINKSILSAFTAFLKGNSKLANENLKLILEHLKKHKIDLPESEVSLFIDPGKKVFDVTKNPQSVVEFALNQSSCSVVINLFKDVSFDSGQRQELEKAVKLLNGRCPFSCSISEKDGKLSIRKCRAGNDVKKIQDMMNASQIDLEKLCLQLKAIKTDSEAEAKDIANEINRWWNTLCSSVSLTPNLQSQVGGIKTTESGFIFFEVPKFIKTACKHGVSLSVSKKILNLLPPLTQQEIEAAISESELTKELKTESAGGDKYKIVLTLEAKANLIVAEFLEITKKPSECNKDLIINQIFSNSGEDPAEFTEILDKFFSSH